MLCLEHNGSIVLTSHFVIGPDDWYVLPQKFYSEEYTFFGHTPGGTWHGEDVAVVLWLVDHPLIFWMVMTTMVGSCLLLTVRMRRRSRTCRVQMIEKDLED